VNSLRTEFERRGIVIVVVSFAEPSKLVRYQEQHQWPFAILADPERKAYHTFNLERLSWLQVFSPATLMRYFKLLREGMRRKDYGKDDIYQSGGDFLLDRAGNILFAHRNQHPSDRPSAVTLLKEIDRVTKRKDS
jgi:peroxiredoxin